ncbi:hypothetical protein Fcan01_11325 [Folsomia candida]|uniref:Uncharacterized protein n=1 Tax=Folsomia candida TaxID=158441 RepID=A0A226EAM6_FOLCA|nr:hypothetical protein Fcan01_11325 [Folsomia candida]
MKPSCNSYYKALLNILFLTCVIPYRPDYGTSNNKYVLKYCPVQMVVCVILSSVSLLFSIFHFGLIMTHANIGANPTEIFYHASLLSDISLGTVCMGTIWLKQESIREILCIGAAQKHHVLMRALIALGIITTFVYFSLFEGCQCATSPTCESQLYQWILNTKRVLGKFGYAQYAVNLTANTTLSDLSASETGITAFFVGLLKFMGLFTSFGAALMLTSSVTVQSEVSKILKEFDLMEAV